MPDNYQNCILLASNSNNLAKLRKILEAKIFFQILTNSIPITYFVIIITITVSQTKSSWVIKTE